MRIDSFTVGIKEPVFVIAGPCVIESREMVFEIAGRLVEITQELGMPFVFKASYDKANRSSSKSFRGLGIDKGLSILSDVRQEFSVPVITDVHSAGEISEVAEVVDVLQTPAFLCRQTDFVQTVARSGRPVNIKKGQFLAPRDMIQVVKKAEEVAGPNKIMVCERGVSFGYNNLVSDMRSLALLRDTNCPVVFDATHSVQLPGGLGSASDGQREFVPVLARAAVAVGVSGIFMETHPEPNKALSDGPNAWPLDLMQNLLKTLKSLDDLVKINTFLENEIAVKS